MTQITVKQLAAAKRTAMNVLPLVNKKERLQAKIDAMQAEIADLNQQIDAQQGYVKSFAAGLTTEQLLVRNENKAFVHNPEVLYFDEEKRVYIVKEADAEAGVAATTEMPQPSGDGDLPFVNDDDAAAAEEARLEAEAARLEEEQKAEEERRQAEIRAAKERLTASKPAPAAPVAEAETEIDPFA